MRTHGRAGLERAVMGSVTQTVLAATQVPIMLMRPGGRRISQFRKLLVPVDGSPGGAMALATAIGFATSSNAALELVQAVVPIPMQAWVGYSGPMSYYDPEWDDEARTSAQGYLDSMAARVRTTGLQVGARMVEGASVPDLIVSAADAADVDAIVMSTHALTGVTRALLGSVADAVVRSAHCPVLLLRQIPTELQTAGSTTHVEAIPC
jgi:nucleotide-binding universal stress UspA family protein